MNAAPKKLRTTAPKFGQGVKHSRCFLLSTMKDVGGEEQECLEAWNFSLRLRLTLSDISKFSSLCPLPACSWTTLRLQTGSTGARHPHAHPVACMQRPRTFT